MTVQAGTEGTTSQGQQENQQQNNTGTGSQGQEVQQQQQQNQTPAPYAPFLERVPESVRGVIEPIFKEWDSNVTQRFQGVHSQYEWAQPWKEIAENYEPDTVSQAIEVLSALEQNPEGFYQALAQAYNFGQGQGQQVPGQQGDPNEEMEVDPRFSQLEETVGTLAQLMLDRQQQEEYSAEEQQLMSELQTLQQQHGDFDMDYVITKIASGVEPEDAVKAYRALVGNNGGGQNNGNGNGQRPPVVMGSGGGVPSQSIDFKNLDRKGTQGLIQQVLAANRQQGG